jgi:hypothetical protein
VARAQEFEDRLLDRIALESNRGSLMSLTSSYGSKIATLMAELRSRPAIPVSGLNLIPYESQQAKARRQRMERPWRTAPSLSDMDREEREIERNEREAVRIIRAAPAPQLPSQPAGPTDFVTTSAEWFAMELERRLAIRMEHNRIIFRDQAA